MLFHLLRIDGRAMDYFQVRASVVQRQRLRLEHGCRGRRRCRRTGCSDVLLRESNPLTFKALSSGTNVSATTRGRRWAHRGGSCCRWAQRRQRSRVERHMHMLCLRLLTVHLIVSHGRSHWLNVHHHVCGWVPRRGDAGASHVFDEFFLHYCVRQPQLR